MATPKVLFLMADYGHDPTETGKQPACDKKMLEGVTQKLLVRQNPPLVRSQPLISQQGADSSAVAAYKAMLQHPSIQSPISWTSPSFSLDSYNLIFFPGGHEKGVRQVIDSPIVHEHVAKYFPQTLSTAPNNTGNDPLQKKAVGAVCHGVMVLSSAKYPAEHNDAGKSILHNVLTTALPAAFEKAAYYGTKLWLGDYYKTYGAGSENVQDSVTKELIKKDQFKNSIGMSPFVVEDPNYRYISARWPGDAKLLGEKLVKLVKGQ